MTTPLIQPVLASPEPQRSPITTPAVLLLGDTGTGKSRALTTFLDVPDLELFVLVTENNGLDTILDATTPDKLGRLHYHVVAPTTPSISTLLKKAHVVNTKGAGDIQKMELGLDKVKYQQYALFLKQLENFHDQRTGQNFGDVTSWKSNRVLAVDSLSGVNYMAVQHVAGNRPTLTQPEYGLVQSLERDLINVLTGLDCYFVLTAHLENATDELTGQRRAYPLSVGKALAPEIPRFFSEVILTKREDQKFFWSTNDDKSVVKPRTMPVGSSLAPTFVQLVEGHNRRVEKAGK